MNRNPKNLLKTARAAKFPRAAAPSSNFAPSQGVSPGRSYSDPRAGLAPHGAPYALPGAIET